MRAYVGACVRAYVRTCVRACVRAYFMDNCNQGSVRKVIPDMATEK